MLFCMLMMHFMTVMIVITKTWHAVNWPLQCAEMTLICMQGANCWSKLPFACCEHATNLRKTVVTKLLYTSIDPPHAQGAARRARRTQASPCSMQAGREMMWPAFWAHLCMRDMLAVLAGTEGDRSRPAGSRVMCCKNCRAPCIPPLSCAQPTSASRQSATTFMRMLVTCSSMLAADVQKVDLLTR